MEITHCLNNYNLGEWPGYQSSNWSTQLRFMPTYVDLHHWSCEGKLWWGIHSTKVNMYSYTKTNTQNEGSWVLYTKTNYMTKKINILNTRAERLTLFANNGDNQPARIGGTIHSLFLLWHISSIKLTLRSMIMAQTSLWVVAVSLISYFSKDRYLKIIKAGSIGHGNRFNCITDYLVTRATMLWHHQPTNLI